MNQLLFRSFPSESATLCRVNWARDSLRISVSLVQRPASKQAHELARGHASAQTGPQMVQAWEPERA